VFPGHQERSQGSQPCEKDEKMKTPDSALGLSLTMMVNGELCQRLVK
jgi:hypothetical protein